MTWIVNAKKNDKKAISFNRIKFPPLSLFFNRNSFFFIDTMQLIILFVLCFFLILTANGKENTCLHNNTNGKHCTSITRRSGQRLIRPIASQNKKCHDLCIDSGYKHGGYCSISKECFRFCSCRS
jgi:hypothetical protein